MQYQIRVCPALQDKTKATKEAAAKVKQETGNDTPSTSKKSPFEPPYIEDLHVGDVEGCDGEEGMAVLLNKYAVLPEHFLVVTKSEFRRRAQVNPADDPLHRSATTTIPASHSRRALDHLQPLADRQRTRHGPKTMLCVL